MKPYLVVGVIDSISDVPDFQKYDFFLAHHSLTHRAFPEEWFFPSLVLDNDKDTSPLEAFNSAMVESFDKDFHLRAWGINMEVKVHDAKYNLVVMHGSLVNGIFRVNPTSELYDATWYGQDYDQSVYNMDLFELILASVAS